MEGPEGFIPAILGNARAVIFHGDLDQPVILAQCDGHMRAMLEGGLGDKTALKADYLDELLKVGRRPGYPTVARAVYANLPSLGAARSRYREVSAPVHLVYGEKDWSRPSDRQANRQLLPGADFTHVMNAGHFIALERPDVPASLLNPAA